MAASLKEPVEAERGLWRQFPEHGILPRADLCLVTDPNHGVREKAESKRLFFDSAVISPVI